MRVIRLNGLNLTLDEREDCLVAKAARALCCPGYRHRLVDDCQKSSGCQAQQTASFCLCRKNLFRRYGSIADNDAGRDADPTAGRGVGLRSVVREKNIIRPVGRASRSGCRKRSSRPFCRLFSCCQGAYPSYYWREAGLLNNASAMLRRSGKKVRSICKAMFFSVKVAPELFPTGN